MDAELKAKWVAALRSGEYRQATGLLYWGNPDAYCCLGVLGCVANGTRGRLGAYGSEGFRNGGYDIALKQIGEKAQAKLSRMNDRGGKTFPEIADYIEKHL
jgi:hypothetical protein